MMERYKCAQEAEEASKANPDCSPDSFERLIQQQQALENRMVDRGTFRYREGFQKNLQSHRESSSGSGHRLLIESIDPMTKAVQIFIDAATGKRGPKHVSTKIFMELGSEVVAFLTAKTIIDNISTKTSAARMALKIAGVFLDELKYRKFKAEAPQLFDWKLRQFNTSSYVHMKRSLDAAVAFANIDCSEYQIPENHRMLLGVKALDIFIESTHFVEIEHFGAASYRETNVIATQNTLDWIKSFNEYYEALSPIYMPTVIPPRPWSNTKNGGYWFALAGKFPLMRTFDGRNQLEDLDNVDMPVVYKALNALQDTSWLINEDVLKVLEVVKYWPAERLPKDMPSYTDEVLPPRPHDIDTNETARRDWRKKAHEVHERNHARRCKTLALTKTVATAKLLTNEKDDNEQSVRFYFPYNLDFRGRAYAIPLYLQPQGDDIQKGLLKFGEGKPLGTLGAAAWLAIHGANCLADAPTGEKLDKLPLQERVDWIYQHNDLIRGVVEDPFSNDWWTRADSPFQFLAFCYEWVGYLREGVNFVSHLPIGMDGSCNGLQHYSALLRDEEGGRAVNLIPSEKPQDIYRTVAGRVVEILERDSKAHVLAFTKNTRVDDDGKEIPEKVTVDTRKFALDWLQWGNVNRGFVKRQVMTLPYGSKKYGFRDQITEFCKGLKKAEQPAFMVEAKDGGFAHFHYMASVIWDALSDIVVAACDGMEFFQKLARLCVKEHVPIQWTAPNGLPIVQAYPEDQTIRIETVLAQVRFQPSIRVAGKKLDRYKQVSGIAPNIVHSLDAAAMMLTVNAALDYGIDHFQMIHDQYSTHAANTVLLANLTRHTFVKMYTETDVLGNLERDILSNVDISNPEIELPSRPNMGTLDLNEVLQSEYFFA